MTNRPSRIVGVTSFPRTFCLCTAQDAVQAARDAACRVSQFAPDTQELGRGIVFYLAELVKNVVDACYELWKYQNIGSQGV